MTKELRIGIYNISVIFLLDVTKRDIDLFYYDNNTLLTDDERNILLKDLDDEQINGLTMYTDSGNVIVWLREKDNINNVVHEIFHVVNIIMSSRGIKLTDEGEPYAYLMGWITQQYYDWIDG